MSGKASARGYLLDTHALLWALERPEALSSTARHAVNSGPNFLSVVCYWEVVVKSMKGKLNVGDPRTWWRDALNQLVATPLPVRPNHVEAMLSLPPIHKDPFDRILIAQAIAEGLALLSTDAEIARYASKSLKIFG